MEVFMYDGGLIHGTGQDKQFEGRVSHFGDELKNGNASIKISKTKVSDSGSYSCIFPRLQPPQTFNIQLVVGRCLKPSVVALNDTKDWSQLQCVVREAPTKPKVEWRDSSGKTLPAEEPQATERGGSYDIILQTTVTKTDQYSCVVQSGDICDLDRSSISVQICGSSTVPVIIAVFCTLLAVGIVLGVLFAKGCISFEKYVQRDSPL
ncbi:butyrophilin-like protein 1 [Xyrichtys novacula]|nr:butyrophilin-like protein 1 [Xyrichtys novacula]